MKKLLCVIPLVFLFCFTISCQDKAAMAELEKAKAQATIEAQNKEIIRELFAAIDAGNFDKIKELLAENFALNVPGSPEPWGMDMLFQAIKTHYEAFPDWKHAIEDVIAEGDKVAVKLTQNGTHKAEYEGIPATGIKARLPAMHLITIVDRKIIDWFAVEDYLGLYMQLGMELKPKVAEKK